MVIIISDDMYFTVGAAEILHTAGHVVNIVDIYSLNNFAYKTDLCRDDIILMAASDKELIDRIFVIALAYNIKVVSVEKDMLPTINPMLWTHGVIPKRIACHELANTIRLAKNINTVCKSVLTLREMEVMNELLKGKNVHAISTTMRISEKTVSAHKLRALKKLGLTKINSRAIMIYGKYRQVLQNKLFY